MSDLLQNDKTACVILSGGLSSRMHTHKALLPFSETQNFLQHIIEVYQDAGIKDIIVVKNTGIDLSGIKLNNKAVFILENYFPENGRLYSIQLGLSIAADADYCFIQNIDNPFVTSALIENLHVEKRHADYISPEYNGLGGHPILISKPVVEKILSVQDNNSTLRDVLSEFTRYKLMTKDQNCILNINNPEDYHSYFANKIKTGATA